MAHYLDDQSRTFSEFLLVPGYSSAEAETANVSLKTPLVKYKKGQKPALSLNIPLVSAVMQAVSDNHMAVALAREGGLSFIYGSQPIERQAAMVAKVKSYKAGFVSSDTNVKPGDTLADLLELQKKTGHSTTAVTEDGTASGKLLGLITSRDYQPDKTPGQTKISALMTPFTDLVCAPDGVSLQEANDLLWERKLNVLPVVDKKQRLTALVFRKDYNQYIGHPNGLLDERKRYMVGAGINTRDYAERVPALIAAGVDVLCIDSSEGHSEWQKRTLEFIRKKYGDKVKIGAGNVVDAEGFRFLVEAGADFVKVGIGGGSICITREQKGIGRGQASAVIEVAKARDEHYKKTGLYVPICSDGGIAHDYQMTIALAMGADFLMHGRYFARFDESPTSKLLINGNYVKEYWGEGSNRARNWQRYDHGDNSQLIFEEGIDSYVPYAGSLHDNVTVTLNKIKATMCNLGALSIPELQRDAKLTLVSSIGIIEGGAHDVVQKDRK